MSDEGALTPAHDARALRVMSLVRWLLLALVTALAAHTTWTHWGPRAHAPHARSGDRYLCPMHPEVRSPSPGVCPICHMDLVPITASTPNDGGAQTDAAHPPELTALTLHEGQREAIGLATAVIRREQRAGSLRVPGVVSVPESGLAQVVVRSVGFVERVAVRQTGERVSRGQTLAWVYSPEVYRAQEELITASRWDAGASSASSDIAGAARRALELLGMSPEDIDAALRARRPMRAIPLRAPIAGVVTRFNAVLGARASPEAPLYELADLSRVWVVASVHERDVGALRPGTPALRVGTSASFSPAGATGAPWVGRVALLEPVLDEATRTLRLRLVVPNRGLALRPGQVGEVELALPGARGLFVPRDALVRTGAHDYVYVDVGGERFEPRSVRVGAAVGDRVEVVAGLAEGDRVVTRGGFMLDSESRLQASLRERSSEVSCESDFDPARFADRHAQCLACERRDAGDRAACKAAIPRPWR